MQTFGWKEQPSPFNPLHQKTRREKKPSVLTYMPGPPTRKRESFRIHFMQR
jgi:hypothetical protein